MPETPRRAEERKSVAVLYGPSAGQTRVISERIAHNLRAAGFPAESINLQGLAGFDLSRCIAAVLLATVHQGKHEQAVVDFVKTPRAELDRLPVAFISSTTEKDPAPPEDMESRIKTAYLKLAEPGEFVKLSELRLKLPDVSSADLDSALDRMYRGQRINLVAQANQEALSDADRESALLIGGKHKHLISIGLL